ncbi:hypothetical protein V6N12_058048 [Hibiscus sabdariffa]|uniref:Uncharacterized protein n=1 Tax=Hibiscus sabdariffa TaxID=183260 RepID=A0ABR2BD17_9ROSI
MDTSDSKRVMEDNSINEFHEGDSKARDFEDVLSSSDQIVLDAFIEACQGPVMVSVPNDSFLESPENPCLEAGWNFEASGGLSLRNHVAEVVEAFVPLTQSKNLH